MSRKHGAACLLAAAAACASAPAANPLGITVINTEAGIVVETVRTEAPAALAGLRAGDILLRYNGVWFADERQARRLLLDSAPGSTVELEFLREGKVQRIFVPV
jgi:S1-C subfamily serine protease